MTSLAQVHTLIARKRASGVSFGAIAAQLASVGLCVSPEQIEAYCASAGIGGRRGADATPHERVASTSDGRGDATGGAFPPLPFAADPIQRRWSLDTPVLWFGEVPWTIRAACEGVLCTGSTGSGKTSGSGNTLVRAFLRAGFGGLVLAVKSDDPARLRRNAEATGRAHHLLEIGPGGHTINVLEYLSRHPDRSVRSVHNVTDFFCDVAEMAVGGGGDGRSDEGFWKKAERALISNTLRVLAHAGGTLTIDDMLRFQRSAPRSVAEASRWHEVDTVFARRTMAALRSVPPGSDERRELETAIEWWLSSFSAQPDKTRESVLMSFEVLAEAFSDPLIRRVFGTTTTVIPEHCLKGAVLSVTIPLLEHRTAGPLAAAIMKRLVQGAIERRPHPTSDTARPVFLFEDEKQRLYCAGDALFQSTARSHRAVCVALTQSIPGLRAQIGGSRAEHVSDAFVSLFSTKIGHFNTCPVTNKYLAEQAGRGQRLKVSGELSGGRSLVHSMFAGWGSEGSMQGRFEDDWIVAPEIFTSLGTGGGHGDVEAIVILGPHTARAAGTHFIRVAFPQDDLVSPADGTTPPITGGRLRSLWAALRHRLRREV